MRVGEEKRLYFYIPLDSLLPFKTLIVRNGPLPVFQVPESVSKAFVTDDSQLPELHPYS